MTCSELEILDLSDNNLSDEFPCFLMNISKLQVLVLRSNKFYGRTGCFKTNGTWKKLQIVDLAHNNFSGELPNKNDTQSVLDHLQFEFFISASLYYKDRVTMASKGLELELQKILTFSTALTFQATISKDLYQRNWENSKHFIYSTSQIMLSLAQSLHRLVTCEN